MSPDRLRRVAARHRSLPLLCTHPATGVPIGSAGQEITAEGGALRRVDRVLTWSPMLEPVGHADLRYRY